MPYEKLWENLSHKRINIPFGSPQLPHFVDPTTQGTEFAGNYYWKGFRSEIEKLNHVGFNVRLWKPQSPRYVGGTAQIKEDVRWSYASYTSVTPFSDVDMVLAHTETGANRWQDFQRQIVNPSQADASVIFPEPESPQLIDKTIQVKGDIRASYSHYFYRDPLSVVDAETGTNHWQDFRRQIENLSHVEADAILPEPASPQLVDETVQVEDIRASYSPYFYRKLPLDMDMILARRETGTNHWQDFRRQIENLGHVETDAILPEPASPQLVDETVQVEDIRASYSPYFYRKLLSVVDAEIGTAITSFTQIWKFYQALEQRLEISEQFDILAQREDNWDGRGSQKPTDLTLAHAKKVMSAFLDSAISAGHRYDTPSISSDGDGNVSAVWYKDERQLHLQIGEHEAEYFRVWGTNIDTEMDVDFLKPDNYLTLWKWLIGEPELHLQIGEHEAEYFRVWGTNIDTEMDVDFLKPDNYLTLWK